MTDDNLKLANDVKKQLLIFDESLDNDQAEIKIFINNGKAITINTTDNIDCHKMIVETLKAEKARLQAVFDNL